jgi:hypothetical protein
LRAGRGRQRGSGGSHSQQFQRCAASQTSFRHGGPHLLELHPVLDHDDRIPQDVDVLQRIAVDGDHIRPPAWLERSRVAFDAHRSSLYNTPTVGVQVSGRRATRSLIDATMSPGKTVSGRRVVIKWQVL